MKLEIGMYVRTKKGSIAKVLGFDIFEEGKGTNIENLEAVYFDKMVNDIDKDIYKGCFNEVFKNAKASHNIIDLIEVGDVIVDNSGRKLEVNLIRVWNDVKEIICNDYNLDDSAITLHNGGIFKVLTHEQFENNCFRIGDE